MGYRSYETQLLTKERGYDQAERVHSFSPDTGHARLRSNIENRRVLGFVGVMVQLKLKLEDPENKCVVTREIMDRC